MSIPCPMESRSRISSLGMSVNSETSSCSRYSKEVVFCLVSGLGVFVKGEGAEEEN